MIQAIINNWGGNALKSRERLLRALNHREADRVPIDMGTPVTSIHREAYVRLKELLGLPDRQFELIDNMQQVVRIEDSVLERFGADTRQLFLKPARPWEKLPDGGLVDEWGVKWKASAGNHYFDMYESPLSQASIGDLDRYPWPDPTDPARVEGLSEEAKELTENTDGAIVLNGFGEAIFGVPSWIRGHIQFYTDFIASPDFLNNYLDRMLDFALGLARNALDAVGRYVHVVRLSDDLGSEKGLIISPHHYRQFIKPRQEKLFRYIKENSDARILLHACGSIYEIIPDLIEIGVDALNPIQVSAKDMDTKMLKEEFGDRITFWGGGCDTQRILPFGTVEEVIEEAKKRIRDLAPGGGFVFAPVHNIQYDVSAEKIVALYDTALETGRYPLPPALSRR
jgi:uroporphyrinogen decarboxylase